MTDTAINTKGVRLDFGKYYGKLITRIPPSHLYWMIANGTSMADYAAAELKRRGTIIPTIEVSPHAINRASRGLMRKFFNGKDSKVRAHDNEGLHSWLVRISGDALKQGTRSGDKIVYRGLLFVFELGFEMPVLKSIMPRNGKGKPRSREGPHK